MPADMRFGVGFLNDVGRVVKKNVGADDGFYKVEDFGVGGHLKGRSHHRVQLGFVVEFALRGFQIFKVSAMMGCVVLRQQRYSGDKAIAGVITGKGVRIHGRTFRGWLSPSMQLARSGRLRL